MAGKLKTVHVESESELGRFLDQVADEDVVLEMEGVRFRLNRIEAPASASTTHRRRRLAPERALNIIGLGASEHGSDVANLKDQYIAEAADDFAGNSCPSWLLTSLRDVETRVTLSRSELPAILDNSPYSS
jgi:hypothetical protein